MKTDEYIVINKTKLEERLKALQKENAQAFTTEERFITQRAFNELNKIKSNSIQLTPLLEDAFNEAREYRMKNVFKHDIAKDYINNLKLDI